jgi:hypothetical protein
MIATQLYYDFTKEVERMKVNMVMTNSVFNRDTQLLMKQVNELKAKVDFNNREMDRRLNELKKIMYQMSDQGKVHYS